MMRHLDNRTFRSLETPAHYFGCHWALTLLAFLLPVLSLFSFIVMPNDTLLSIAVILCALGISKVMLLVGSWLGTKDPFWVEGGLKHLTEEKDYLDV